MRRLVMIGTEKGAFFLWGDASGAHWEIEGPIMKGWKVLDVMLDRRGAPTLYAAAGSWVYGATVQISRDWGKTWTQVEHGPVYGKDSGRKLNNIWTIVPGHASQPDVLYAGVDEAGLFVSRDRGLHWEELTGVGQHPTRPEWVPGAGGLCCHSVCVDAKNPDRVWVGISAVGVLRTDDGGANWAVKNDGLTIIIEAKDNKHIGSCVHRLVADPTDPKRLYQQNHKGVFRSVDAGDTWQRIENGLEGWFGFPMVMHPHDPKTLFIVPEETDEFRMPKDGRLTVFRSRDCGDSWEPLRDGLPEHFYSGVMRQALAMDGTEAGGVYFGASGGQIFASDDNGDHWRQLPFTLPRILSVNAACVD